MPFTLQRFVPVCLFCTKSSLLRILWSIGLLCAMNGVAVFCSGGHCLRYICCAMMYDVVVPYDMTDSGLLLVGLFPCARG